MTKKIKVLHIIKTLDLGGAETNLLNLLNAMDTSKVENIVAYSYGGELEAAYKEANITLFKYAEKNHKVKSFASLSIILKLRKFIKQNDIDIIHTHNFTAHIWGTLAGKLAGIKVLEHVHDFRYLEPADFKRRRGENNQYKFIRYLKNSADKVIILTEQNEEFILENQLNTRENVHIIRNGISFDSIATTDSATKQQLLDKFSIPKDAVIIFTPIRMAPEKNADLIIRVAKNVVTTDPNIVFLLVGDGPLFDSLQEFITREGCADNIKMPGFIQNITELLALTDIFLLPSFLELHSIAILEAMSQQVPVVVSENTGSNSAFIINEENGYLLDPFKDEGWADTLLKLAADKELRTEIGIKGYDTCKHLFDIKGTAEKITEVYQQMVG